MVTLAANSRGSELDSDVAVFVPGQEDSCRAKLDKVVAEDSRTFTLGDRGGPLAILRVPDEVEMPHATQWEGDLPAITLATPADIMQRAEKLLWMRPARGGGSSGASRIHPPRWFVADYLLQMRGCYAARPLRGIVRVPRIDDDGSVCHVAGYDTSTGLFHDKTPAFDLPLTPTRDEALLAAAILLKPFSKYKFGDVAAGNALLLAAVLTALERPFLATAPMFVVRSSMPGTGKGLIVRSLIRLAFDTVPVVITWGGSNEEFEKRLGALLLQAPAGLSIDNANGMQIQGDLLEAILTEGSSEVRPLGRSETVKVRCRSFITLTGNNPIITGDMARRALVMDIVPRSSDPESDRYEFNPVEVIQRRRTDFLRAAFIVMRAYRLAGCPQSGLPSVGSFGEWSRKVRDLVSWLTGHDVSVGFRQNKKEDPRRLADASLLAALFSQFGVSRFRSADAITTYERVLEHRRFPQTRPPPAPSEQRLHAALDDVLGSRGVNAKLFGYWARRIKGALIEDYVLETHHDPATNANSISVRKT